MIRAFIDDLKKELWLRRREQLVWKTKDGKLVPLKQMTTDHIINAIRCFDENDEEEIVLENSDILD